MSKPFDPPNRFGWGFNQDKGTLTFFTPSTVRAYRADPAACWFKSRRHPSWRGSFGGEDFQLRHLAEVDQRYKIRNNTDFKAGYHVKRPGLLAMKRFFARLDPQAATPTYPLSHDSWLLYCLLVRAPELRELATDNLALAMLVALHRRDHRHRFARAGRLAWLKRREIAGACGLPAQRQWVKLLGRIAPRSVSVANLSHLRDMPQSAPEAIERMRHLQTINGGVIRLLSRRLGQHIHASLLEEVAADPWQHSCYWYHRGRTESLLADALRMLHSLAAPIPVFRSMAQLQAVHDDAAMKCAQRSPHRFQPFAPPPLPETEHIIGLRSPVELHDEAVAQRNCLSLEFWAERCYLEELYVYRITAPERASVALVRRPDGRWSVLEFKARFNAEPTKQTVRLVQQWLRDGHRALAEGWRPGDAFDFDWARVA